MKIDYICCDLCGEEIQKGEYFTRLKYPKITKFLRYTFSEGQKELKDFDICEKCGKEIEDYIWSKH